MYNNKFTGAPTDRMWRNHKQCTKRHEDPTNGPPIQYEDTTHNDHIPEGLLPT